MALKLDKLPVRYLDYLDQFTLFLILTADALRRLADPDASKTASRKIPKRLCHKKWLTEIQLPWRPRLHAHAEGGAGPGSAQAQEQGPGYMLTPRAVSALDLPKRKNAGISHDGVIQHIGLAYACLEADLDKLSVKALGETYPGLLRRGLPAGNYAEDAEGRVFWIHVSHGALAHNLAAKIKNIVRKRDAMRAFRDLIETGKFGVVVAVPSAEVATEFTAALKPLKIDPRVHIRPVVVSQLASLLLTRNRHGL